jgi:hypothetical protein
MTRTLRIAAFSSVGLLLATTRLNSEDVLRMQVSPAVSRAPAVLTIRVNVEPSTDNRLLQVVAECATFYRSSEIELDGMDATAHQVVEFRNVPAGLYQVTGVLVGTQGPLATVLRMAKVEAPAGSR